MTEKTETKLTPKILAARLSGNQYGDEISSDQKRLAKESGLLVVFGYSDDNAEFRGLFDEEVGCYGGGNMIEFTRHGIVRRFDDLKDDDASEDEFAAYFATKPEDRHHVIPVWDKDYISWQFRTDSIHEQFLVMEGDETYCVGLVIDMNSPPKNN